MTAEEKLLKIRNLVAPYVGQPIRSDQDDFCAYDWVGSNVDDAYALGVEDGERMLTEAIVAILDGSHIQLE